MLTILAALTITLLTIYLHYLHMFICPIQMKTQTQAMFTHKKKKKQAQRLPCTHAPLEGFFRRWQRNHSLLVCNCVGNVTCKCKYMQHEQCTIKTDIQVFIIAVVFTIFTWLYVHLHFLCNRVTICCCILSFLLHMRTRPITIWNAGTAFGHQQMVAVYAQTKPAGFWNCVSKTWYQQCSTLQ